MDLSELALEPGVGKGTGQSESPAPDASALIAQLGGEVATALSQALDRVAEFSATGRIDRAGLAALREAIDRARRAGIAGQQLVRLGNGRLELVRERLDLGGLLGAALSQRGREIAARGIELRLHATIATVTSDATLVFSLLLTLLDWSFDHAISRIDLSLATARALPGFRLRVAFACCTPRGSAADRSADAGCMLESASAFAEVGADTSGAQAEEALLNSMSWQLLERTAGVLELPLQRRDGSGRTELSIEFPTSAAPGRAAETDNDTDSDPNQDAAHAEPLGASTQPSSGRHLVVLAPRRDVRNAVREALRPMGLMIDFVASVDEAHALCAAGPPHALVYEAALGGDRFDRLREQLLAAAPAPAFIRIAEEGRAFEILNAGPRQVSSVGRDALVDLLPAALMFELSRQG